jgi:hypothetical protein
VGAVAANSLTTDGFVVIAAGVLPILAGLVLREVTATFELLGQPRREARRAWLEDRRSLDRANEARERERRRRERNRDQLAA